MCGICGMLGAGRADEGRIRTMARAIAHRGPDDEGYFVRDNVALGHRRLSIIDLDGGAQPMGTPDGAVWIAFNGEIYNFKALRKSLSQEGYQFRTHSDTEVILNAYLRYGTDCLQHLRGMFAFAIWDDRKKRLFIARDRLGQKPLYYSLVGEEFLFGSEIKALLAINPGLAELNKAALQEYLTLRVISSPKSMFEGIKKLPPAHFLTFSQEEGLVVQRYWDLSFEPKLEGDDEELTEELEHQLVEAIRLHLVSDVPVGAFMSGGLDSTLIVALLMKHGLAEDFRTFSVGLPFGRFDEAPIARLVAEQYGTRHYEEEIHPSLLSDLPRLVNQLDEPSDSLASCMDLVARMARREVKVVLGGDGGDELFGGYDRYYGNRIADRYARVPSWIRSGVIGPALNLVPDGKWYKSIGHQMKWLHRLAAYSGGERYVRSLSYTYLNESYEGAVFGPMLVGADGDGRPGDLMRAAFDRADASDLVDRMLYADCQSRLPDHPVMIQDRMTMAHGLEARSPFMDHKLAEFAAQLPARMKVRGRSLRHIHVLLARRHLPREVLERKKQGFSSALPYLLKDELDVLYSTFLGDSHLVKEGLLKKEGVAELVREHRSGKADHGNRLWLLVNSEVWFRMFIESHSESQVSEDIAGGVATSGPTTVGVTA